MVTNFEYEDTREEGEKRVWCFIDKFLQLHKAHVLESMRIQLDHYQCIQIDHHQYYNDTVLSKCVSYALDHCVRELAFSLPLYRTQILFLPPNVYTSKTLVTLTLAGIIIDVPSLLCLPSLQTLVLIFVVYKDQNSHVRLLANCPSLKNLDVKRDSSDNVTRELIILFLHNSPILKVLTISYVRAALTPPLSLVLKRMWLLAARISHFRGTNKVLYQDACCPILRSLCGKGLEEEDKRENVWRTSLQTQNV
ncbi:unnamed protein product [Brassica rapa]|uniref:FBD domain-containing protein n=1 Tax=Brassica campestris TaxID=3711 RepID=A0A8D9GD19_BRACM|nr:unnamed protein product [Brassica rapa]